MYLDTGCTYRETVNPHTYIFTGPCTVTGHPVTVTVQPAELFQLRQGKLIQDALVSNTPEEREFLMTGISGDGWQQMFPSKRQRTTR